VVAGRGGTEEVRLDGQPVKNFDGRPDVTILVAAVKLFGWGSLAVLLAALLNNYLTYWAGWPGPLAVFQDSGNGLAAVQFGILILAGALATLHVTRNPHRALVADSETICGINTFLANAAFWSVVLIGVADFVLAFMYGEQIIKSVLGPSLAKKLANATFRGTFLHFPLIGVGTLIAIFFRARVLPVLAALIVSAELVIVLFRFVFSYEQSYFADLVRFWYVGLFLFGSAYTLHQEAHVRVDVIYAGLSRRAKGLINAVGTLLLGMPFCWLILWVGLSQRTGPINSALLSFENEGTADGLYILYLMTVFMGVFAVFMLIEFVGFLFRAVDDALS